MKMIHETRDRKGRLHPAHLREVVEKRYFLDLSPEYQASIVLAGTGRSGTTWISEVINYNNEYRMMDEPFRNISVDICAHFNAMQYIRPGDDDPAFLDPVSRVLSGRLRNSWTDRFNTRAISTRRLVKAIRANLFLKWMVDHFPGMKVAFLMRHPAAVTLSQWKLDWEIDLEAILLDQPALMADFLEPWRDEIARADSLFEKRLWMWCVENHVALTQLQTADVHLAFYEQFCTEPEVETARLFNYYGKQWDDSVFEAMSRPSNSSKPDSAVMTGKRRVDNWMSIITVEQRDLVGEMLQRFGLDTIYSVESPWPDVAAAAAFLDGRAEDLLGSKEQDKIGEGR